MSSSIAVLFFFPRCKSSSLFFFRFFLLFFSALKLKDVRIIWSFEIFCFFKKKKSSSYLDFGSRLGYFPFLGDTTPSHQNHSNLYFYSYSSKFLSHFSWIPLKNLKEPTRVRLLGSLLVFSLMGCAGIFPLLLLCTFGLSCFACNLFLRWNEAQNSNSLPLGLSVRGNIFSSLLRNINDFRSIQL